jgi:hypothetical protein
MSPSPGGDIQTEVAYHLERLGDVHRRSAPHDRFRSDVLVLRPCRSPHRLELGRVGVDQVALDPSLERRELASHAHSTTPIVARPRWEVAARPASNPSPTVIVTAALPLFARHLVLHLALLDAL